MFLGENLLALLTLALGGAMAIGTAFALFRPREEVREGELERAPVIRSVVMIAIGSFASVWAFASLISA